MQDKDGLFKQAFAREELPPPPAEININDDIIEISPDKECFSTPAPLKPVASPMSKFKQQRLKEKEKKEKRRMKHSPQLIQKKLNPGETIRKISLDSNHWDTARILARDIRGTISSYADIAIKAIGLQKVEGIEITGESLEILTSRCNIVFNDIDNLKTKLDDFQATIDKYTGTVQQNDLPFFLSIYEDMLVLNQDVINVLTEPCDVLTDLISVVVGMVQEEREKEKKKQEAIDSFNNDPSIEIKGEENV